MKTSSIDTPALVVDLDALERNIATLAARAKAWGIALRSHAKTHKCSAIARRQVEAGAIGIACATIDEAEVMVEAGLPGVLVTSPLATEHKVRRFTELLQRRSDLAVVADHPRHVSLLAEMARRYDVAPSVLVDVDVGDHRTGTATLEAALNLAQQIQEASNLRFAGVQGYAGRIQHSAAFARRSSEAAKVAEQLAELRNRLELLGLAPSVVTGGGTGTHAIDGPGGVFTELQVGSYIFMDAEYAKVGLDNDLRSPFEPALFVHTTVISSNQRDLATTDGGTKAFALNGPPPEITHGPAAGCAYEFQGDEHGRVNLKSGVGLSLGDRLECLTPHCDPTVCLYDRIFCVRGGEVVDIWPIDARGRRFAA
jgi:D-serine deaminase-like pyridoxal phosphate-dependent protein